MSEQSTEVLQKPAYRERVAARRARLINRVALALALLWLALVGLTLAPDMDDFHYFRRGALDQLQAGDPYASLPEWQPSAQPRPDLRPDKVEAYLYPPTLAYLIQPLALLSQGQGQLIWFVLNSAALAVLIVTCIRLSGSALARRYWGVVVLGVLVAPPTRLCLQLGQLGILIALLLVGGYALARRRPAFAGFLLALASMIKLYPGLMLVYYALRRSRGVLVSAVISGSALLALSLLVYGPMPYVNFVSKVLLSGYYPFAAEFNISLVGFWDRLLAASLYAVPLADVPVVARALALAMSAAVLAICVWAAGRRGVTSELHEQIQFSVWLCAMMLISPVNGSYNLVALLLPLLAALRYLELHNDRTTRNWLIVATALACWPPAWTDWQPALYNGLHIGIGLLLLTPAIYGLALYLWLVVRLARRFVLDAAHS